MTAERPPMGWNSWDCYGTTVTEAEVLANARYMADHLLTYGWDTVVVDIDWYDPTARAQGYNPDPPVVLDGYGRQLPAPNRFPSAADGAGFGPLADQVHGMGLKFGVHVLRGIPRHAVAADLPVLGTPYRASEIADPDHVCPWNPDNLGLDHRHPGAQAYYDSQLRQFAGWGVDFVKADDMLAPFHEAEVAAYGRAVQSCGRPMVLSLSPGTDLDPALLGPLRSAAQMWRISGDLWDRWSDVEAQFDRLARWVPHSGPGGWADADMLPLGRIGIRAERGEDRDSLLTLTEQQTLLTLWVMARSPLMMGGDLPTTRAETIDLLSRPDVLRLLTASRDNRQVSRDETSVVWTAEATDRDARYLAVFGLADAPTTVTLPPDLLAGAAGPPVDLWTGRPVELPDGRVPVEGHGARLLLLPTQTSQTTRTTPSTQDVR